MALNGHDAGVTSSLFWGEKPKRALTVLPAALAHTHMPQTEMKRFVPQPLIPQRSLQTQRPANRWLLYKLGRRRDRAALFSGCFFHGCFHAPRCQTAPPGRVPTASISRGWRQPSEGGDRTQNERAACPVPCCSLAVRPFRCLASRQQTCSAPW